jgi:hypothetical protein
MIGALNFQWNIPIIPRKIFVLSEIKNINQIVTLLQIGSQIRVKLAGKKTGSVYNHLIDL